MSTNLEKRILQFGLTLSSIYQLYQIINGIISGASTIVLNVVIGFFIISLLFISTRLKSTTGIAILFHLVMLPILVYFWTEFGGLAGTVPMIMYAYVSMIICTLHGTALIIILIIYSIVFFLLSFFPQLTNIPVHDASKVDPIQPAIDFFVIALIITTFLIYLKDRLFTYRARISHRHQQLQQLSLTLQKQNEELHESQEETLLINENLENIVEKHIKGIEEKNRELGEYAFINAHLLRAPICRMLGIINLMEIEGADADLTSVKEKAMQIDSIIRRINDAL